MPVLIREVYQGVVARSIKLQMELSYSYFLQRFVLQAKEPIKVFERCNRQSSVF